MIVIEAKDVEKDYALGKLSVRALRHINLQVSRGEMLCITGPSGSGKTSLLSLMGLVDVPTSGEILLQGMHTHNLPYAKAARIRRYSLGFIFQSYNLFPVLNAFENVEYPLLFFPFSKKERRDRVWRAMTEVQIREVALQRPNELSGGQQQRVAIARALVTDPLMILADEPTANLDSESAEAVMTAMKRINDNLKTTFVFSTHDARVMKYATRVVSLRDGSIQNRKDEVATDETHDAIVTNLFSKRLSQ